MYQVRFLVTPGELILILEMLVFTALMVTFAICYVKSLLNKRKREKKIREMLGIL